MRNFVQNVSRGKTTPRPAVSVLSSAAPALQVGVVTCTRGQLKHSLGLPFIGRMDFFFLNTKLLLANMTVINVRNIDEVQNWQFQRQVCYERDTPQTIKMIKFILCARGFYGD